MDSSHGLTDLQKEVLDAFFQLERRFVLTGGGALIGFHLHHRRSDDLDLFTKPPVGVEEGLASLHAAASRIGATVESVRTHPEFRRLIVRRGEQTAVVDLVVDRTPDVDPAIETASGIRVHTLREIGANKICALLGRAEIRDLIDLRAILAKGLELTQLLRDAERKDGGVSPATLAWLLDGLRIAPGAVLPAGVAVKELEDFRVSLVTTLRRMSLPAS